MKQLFEDWLDIVLPYFIGAAGGLIVGILIGMQL